jgi:ribokinase
MGFILMSLMKNVRSLMFDSRNLHFDGIIGTGGIGSGKFFILNGNQTLGREESRSGHFLEVQDYCKQHIILHYCKVLMGSSFVVIPIGKIGDDYEGEVLYNEMKETGFVLDWIEKIQNSSTLFSFCFYYPDGNGGNLTTDNSASSQVDNDFIEKTSSYFAKLGTRGIVMAAPEVPLSARARLLQLGRQYGLLCTASFTSEEINAVIDSGIMTNVDLLAINIDEAYSIAGETDDKTNTTLIVQSAIKRLKIHNSNIMVSVTMGKQGSFCWDGHKLNSFPAIKTKAVSTAGAGDAFFSGILCGLALGLSLFEAQQLASLVAGLSVTSPHTIHKGIDRYSLNKFMGSSEEKFSEIILKLLEE